MTRGFDVLSRLAVVACALAAFATGAAAQTPVALDAQVVPIQPQVTTASYPTTDYGNDASSADDKQGTTTWRVVNGTGNCCENYVTVTRSGRLLDFGGSYLNFSDDRGSTWRSVRPLEPLVNGEGAVVAAPGGDVLGVEWDPYSGDHLLAFKYEALTGRWLYEEMPLHQPFYDREWIAVVPGPFTIGGQVVPYVSFVKGGVPKELWYYATDGITYTQVTSKFVDRTLADAARRIATAPGGDLDLVQPNTNGGMTALGGGNLLGAGDVSDDFSLFDVNALAWYGAAQGDGAQPAGLFQTDSAGRLHNVVPEGTRFVYRWSSDGGTTWRSTEVTLPEGSAIEQIDFRASKEAGVAAVGIHAHDSITGTDRDLVYKLAIKGAAPRVLRRYAVGLGDANSTSGVGNDVRMDFQTVAIFPDGKVAVSFLDSTTASASPTTGAMRTTPALAIEGSTKVTGPAEGPTEPQPVGVAPPPISGTVIIPSPGAGERVGGVTSAYLEFTVPAGADAARMSVHATPNLPADVDLYLQRQLVDGSWTGDLASGTTGSLTGESMETARLLAGSHYRIEAHLWAGAPATQVAIQATFYNSAGVAGI
jgi:hypothetical protein